MSNNTRKSIYGVGINDAPYQTLVQVTLEDKYPSGQRRQKAIWKCPYFTKWLSMITRCYSKKFVDKNPTYRDCTVCVEWLYFMNFRKWMVTQDWEGKSLDKDLLVKGDKVYSSETCIFIPQIVNTFITQRRISQYLVGVSRFERDDILRARCSNTFTGKGEHLGYFASEEQAHLTWKKRKHELACQLADSEYVTDDRVEEALRNRYKNYTIVEDHLS